MGRVNENRAAIAVRPGKLNDTLPPMMVQQGMEHSRNLHLQAERVGAAPVTTQPAPLMQGGDSWLSGAVPSQQANAKKSASARRRANAKAKKATPKG